MQFFHQGLEFILGHLLFGSRKVRAKKQLQASSDHFR